MGANMWLRVTYAATEGNELPFGEDRFVLAGIQHLAIEQESPIVLFNRVGHLLQTFGLAEDGRNRSAPSAALQTALGALGAFALRRVGGRAR